jgi:DNA-binding NarL/FixJ family response regulator
MRSNQPAKDCSRPPVEMTRPVIGSRCGSILRVTSTASGSLRMGRLSDVCVVSATGGYPETFAVDNRCAPMSTEPRLLERDREVAAIDSLIADVRDGHGNLVAVIGPAGIGKTGLLLAVRHRATNAGVQVLWASGAEFERGLAFAGAAQLFQGPLHAASAGERSRLLAGAARLGGELLGFGTREPDELTADRSFAVFHGLYWLCANLAARLPLVMIIDDAHWLDAQSLEWIEYLARRLEGLAVLIVVAARPEEAAGQHLARTANEIRGQIVELQPLSEEAVCSLLESALDQPTQPAFAVAFQESTGGNPFLVHELLRTIHDEAITPDGDGAHAIRTLASDRIARAVLLRLHRLSSGSVELARAISILGRSGSLSVAARLAQLDEATAAGALEALTAADILAKGTELRFRHPVVHASIYDDVQAPARAMRHRRAARLLAESGAPLAEIASQLIEAEPLGDPWTVSVLRDAAANAAARGAPTTAMTLLERALAERRGVEDPELLLELGRAALAALDIPRAIEALTRARDSAGSTVRGQAALELARVMLHAGRPREAIGVLREELENGRRVKPELRLWLEVEYALYAAPDPDAIHASRRFGALKGRDVSELAALAAASSVADTAREAVGLAHRAMAGGVLVRALDAASAWFLAPWMLVRADRLDDAADVVAEALDYSRAAGSQAGFARASWLQAEIDHRTGELLSAEAHAYSAYAIAADGGSLWMRMMSGALLAQILADRGELVRAHEVLDQLDISILEPDERLARTVRYARAHAALLAGRPEQAVDEFEHLQAAFRAAPAWRARFATGTTPYAIALTMIGRTAEASQTAEDELAWAESWGAPRFIGMALRAKAHTRRDTDRIKDLRAAVTTLENTPARLELARALGDLGGALRRQNHRLAAREPLLRALDLTRRCRADKLANHLRAELRAAGAKPRRDAITGRDALTASETRIAQMAATGMTNAQVAQALFLTPGTIEKHLTSVYSKLGITTRRDLAAALRTNSPWIDEGPDWRAR